MAKAGRIFKDFFAVFHFGHGGCTCKAHFTEDVFNVLLNPSNAFVAKIFDDAVVFELEAGKGNSTQPVVCLQHLTCDLGVVRFVAAFGIEHHGLRQFVLAKAIAVLSM